MSVYEADFIPITPDMLEKECVEWENRIVTARWYCPDVNPDDLPFMTIKEINKACIEKEVSGSSNEVCTHTRYFIKAEQLEIKLTD